MAKIPFTMKPFIGNLLKDKHTKIVNEKLNIKGMVSKLVATFNTGNVNLGNCPENPQTNSKAADLSSPSHVADNKDSANLSSKVVHGIAKGYQSVSPLKVVDLPSALKSPLSTKLAEIPPSLILPKIRLLSILQESFEPLPTPAVDVKSAVQASDDNALHNEPALEPLVNRALTQDEKSAGKIVLGALKKAAHKRQYEAPYQRQYQEMKEGNKNNEVGTYTLNLSYPDEQMQVHFVEKKAIGLQSTKDKRIPLDTEEAGSSKRLATKGTHFVSLEMLKDPNIKVKSDDELRSINKDSLKLFEGLTAIHSTLFIDKEHAIARNGGTVLLDYIFPLEENQNTVVNSISVNSFETVLKDLKTLHARGVHLIDIKLENMAFDGKKVVMIDTDDFIKKGSKLETYTEGYTTRELLMIERISRASMQPIYRTNIDAFASLLSIIESTEGEMFETEEESSALRNFGLLNKKINAETPSELEKANAWIEKNVKPESQDLIKQLVKQPAKLTVGVELYDAIEWGPK